MRDSSPRINNLRYVCRIMIKIFKARVNLSRTWPIWHFSNPRVLQKWSEVTYLNKFELGSRNLQKGTKKLYKNFISIGENWLNKKTTPSINVLFSSNVGTKSESWLQKKNHLEQKCPIAFLESRNNKFELKLNKNQKSNYRKKILIETNEKKLHNRNK